MAKKKATSMDVAREAGVSQATVSMILNKKYNVSFSKETIRQVTEAAEKLAHPRTQKNKQDRRQKSWIITCQNSGSAGRQRAENFWLCSARH